MWLTKNVQTCYSPYLQFSGVAMSTNLQCFFIFYFIYFIQFTQDGNLKGRWFIIKIFWFGNIRNESQTYYLTCETLWFYTASHNTHTYTERATETERQETETDRHRRRQTQSEREDDRTTHVHTAVLFEGYLGAYISSLSIPWCSH